MAAWGVGSWIYNSGYYGYQNPYYVGDVVVDNSVINYSQPLVASTEEPEESDPALQDFDAAREAFKRGEYDQSLRLVDKALTQMPDDAAIHEFRALILFATAEYSQAAATLYAVLSVGPGWDWTTLISLYSDVDVYTAQLRVLEKYCKSNPSSADAHFVLAYHYLTCGHSETAAREFQQVIRLKPQDKLSAQLFQMVSGSDSDAQEQETGGADDKAQAERGVYEFEKAATPIDASQLLGTWKASREDQSKFELALKDGRFTWSYSQGGKTQTFDGNYTVASDLLVLEPSEGGSMTARISPQGKNGFHFALVGSGADDPGLNFSR